MSEDRTPFEVYQKEYPRRNWRKIFKGIYKTFLFLILIIGSIVVLYRTGRLDGVIRTTYRYYHKIAATELFQKVFGTHNRTDDRHPAISGDQTVYSWTDENGKKHFSDVPPPPNAKNVQIIKKEN